MSGHYSELEGQAELPLEAFAWTMQDESPRFMPVAAVTRAARSSAAYAATMAINTESATSA